MTAETATEGTGTATTAESAMVGGVRRRVFLICALSSLAHVVLLAFAGGGLRGSDQFWYVGDLQTLLSGARPHTNIVFPGPVVRGDFPIDATNFAHYTGVFWLVYPFARVLGAYTGWLVFNAAATLGAASLVFATVRRLTSPHTAAWAYATYLLTPVVFWMSANPLQEAAYGFASALLVWLLVRAGPGRDGWTWLCVAACGAILLNAAYVIIALGIVPIVMIFAPKERRRSALLLGIATVLLCFGVWKLKPVIFPESFQPSLRAIIVNSIPYQSNMAWFQRVAVGNVTAELMIAKIRACLLSQFQLGKTIVFYGPANLAILGSLLLLPHWRKNNGRSRLLAALLGLAAMYLIIGILHQNQFRYALFFLPAAIAGTFVSISPLLSRPRRRRRIAGIAGVLALTAFLAADAALALHLRRDGRQTSTIIRDARTHVEGLPRDARVVYETTRINEGLTVGFAVRPRLCMLVAPAQLSETELRRALEIFRPDVIVCAADSPLTEYTLDRLGGPLTNMAPSQSCYSARRLANADQPPSR